jgi:hypothetical protein
MLSVVLPTAIYAKVRIFVVMLSAFMPSVICLSVVAPTLYHEIFEFDNERVSFQIFVVFQFQR